MASQWAGAVGGTKVKSSPAAGVWRMLACLTEKRTGNGVTLHLGSAFSRSTVKALFEHTGILEPFRKWLSAPQEVELVLREKDGKRFLFALNYTGKTQVLLLQERVLSLFDGREAEGSYPLPAYGTAVFEVRA